MAGNNSLGTIRGTIEIDYDGAGVVRAVKGTDDLKKSGDKLDKTMSGVLKTFGKFAKAGAIVAASSLATNSALNLIAGTLAVFAPLLGAGLAILPGILAGAAAAGIVAKLAFAGMGEVLKAAGGDAEKFNEAIKELPPNAQAFARAYRASLGPLKQVQKAIQDTFFRGLAPQLTAVANRIVTLRGDATDLAAALGGVASKVLDFVGSNAGIAAFGSALRFARQVIVNMDGAIKPLLTSFAGLVTQAEEFSGAIGDGIAIGLLKVANFVKGIDLAALFEKAAPIAQSLGIFLRNIAVIAGQLFSVFNVDGANAAGILGELSQKLADFLQSAQGQEALAAIGTMLQSISGGAGQVFLALLTALAPVIVAIAPAITDLANTVSSILVPALAAASPIFEAIARFVSENTAVFGPLAAVIIAAAAAYKLYTAVTKAWAAAEAVASALRLKAVATWLANTAAIVANRVALLASVVVMNVVRAATIAWTAVQWLLNAALTANPIGLIIVGIAALIAIIVLIATKTTWFQTIWKVVWGGIKAAAKAVADWFMNTIVPSFMNAWNQLKAIVSGAINFIIGYFKFWQSVIRAVLNGIKIVFLAIWNAIVSFIRSRIQLIRTIIQVGLFAARAIVQAVLNAIRTVFATVWNAIKALVTAGVNTVLTVIRKISQIVTTVRNAFNSAKSAAASGIANIISLVRGLPGKAVAALGNLGGRLFQAGKNLVRGFIDGIASMIGAVADKARSVVSAVTRFLPGSPAKEGPLSGRGYVLLRARRFMGDFAKGIRTAAQLPRKAMAAAVRPVATVTTVNPATSTSRAFQDPRPPDFGPYAMTLDGKVLSTFVIDTVTGRPRTVAKTQTEGARVVAWAGSGRTA